MTVQFGQGAFQLYYQNKPVLNPALGKLATVLIKDTRRHLAPQPADTVYEKEVSHSKRVVGGKVEGVFLYAHPQDELILYSADEDYLKGKTANPGNKIQKLDLETVLGNTLDVYAFDESKSGGYLLY